MTDPHLTQYRSTRRTFLQRAGSAGAAALGAASILPMSGCSSMTGASSRQASGGLIRPNSVILFQGDSITDAGRDRSRENTPNDVRALGSGYAFLAASQLLAEHPAANLKIYNRGISGNKVFQLAERWDADCISLKPDVVSVLIGVNDIWHRLNGQYSGTVEVYEKDYLALLERTRKALPQVKLVICEPFVLRCGAVNDKWFPEFTEYRAAARRVADSFNAVFVPFQSMFDEATRKAPANYWAADGVHPTVAGCHLMARIWLEAVSSACT
jgi:lysophospholipase L1-like esterase